MKRDFIVAPTFICVRASKRLLRRFGLAIARANVSTPIPYERIRPYAVTNQLQRGESSTRQRLYQLLDRSEFRMLRKKPHKGNAQ